MNRIQVFDNNNARSHHTLLETCQKLLQLGWDVLTHLPYFPDFAPLDILLFRSPQNSLRGKVFDSDDDVKQYLDQFFAAKDQNFSEHRIMKLPERWQIVVNDQYFVQ